jgi:hypothetical protein
MDYALNFARTNLQVDSPTLLSSPFMLLVVAFWADRRDFRISSEDEASFRKWFLIANAKGRYSRGSSETILDQDLAVLRSGDGARELTQRLEQQVGRLHFTPAELVGRTSRSAAFKTLFLAMRSDGARDWKTNLEISPKHSGSADRIEFHHIFPKAFMKKARPNLEAADVDDLANLAFISAKTNKDIRDRAPSEYAADYDTELLAVQLVTFEDGTDDPREFERFLDLRRTAIAERLNRFLGLDANP